MTFVAKAAMVLFYDIVPEGVEAHDDWHTHEHFEERVSIPGFLRATRWVNLHSGPRYLVTYEVENVDVLSDAPYLGRLNNPTPWTQEVMPSFRGMTRGFCNVTASAGVGTGNSALAIRLSPAEGMEEKLRSWLREGLFPSLAMKRGLTSALLLEPAAKPPMTREQSIRGKDAELPWVVLVTGYSAQAIERAGLDELSVPALKARGAGLEQARARYRLDNFLAKAPQ